MKSTKQCDGMNRRDFLRVGGLTALGPGLGDFFHLQRAFAVGARSPLAYTEQQFWEQYIDVNASANSQRAILEDMLVYK